MSADWGYSKLAHLVKLNGGPEKYLEKIAKYNYQQGIKAGKRSQTPVIIGAVVIGGLVVEGIHRAPTIIGFCKNMFVKQEITDDEVKDAKEMLIRGLQEDELDER